jgi:GLPGLI family protein
MNGTKKILLLTLLIFSSNSFAQIKAGKIIFERKTNIEKEYKDADDNEEFSDYLKKYKIKIDSFELIFNDTLSIFKPIISDEVDELDWATSNNVVLQNQATLLQTLELSIWGQKLYIQDSIRPKQWKITESKRVIGNYECRKAIWQKNDSTRIYAWYSTEVLSNCGPEGINGLPGTILGLATEDGGVIYFAKSIQALTPNMEEFNIDIKRKKTFTYKELRVKLNEEYGKEEWGKKAISRIFRWF